MGYSHFPNPGSGFAPACLGQEREGRALEGGVPCHFRCADSIRVSDSNRGDPMTRQKPAAEKLTPEPDQMKSKRFSAQELSRPVREMVEGLHAVCDAVEAGVPLDKVATVRTCTIDVRLPELSSAQIRSIRNSLGLSQALFATSSELGCRPCGRGSKGTVLLRQWPAAFWASSATILSTGEES